MKKIIAIEVDVEDGDALDWLKAELRKPGPHRFADASPVFYDMPHWPDRWWFEADPSDYIDVVTR